MQRRAEFHLRGEVIRVFNLHAAQDGSYQRLRSINVLPAMPEKRRSLPVSARGFQFDDDEVRFRSCVVLAHSKDLTAVHAPTESRREIMRRISRGVSIELTVRLLSEADPADNGRNTGSGRLLLLHLPVHRLPGPSHWSVARQTPDSLTFKSPSRTVIQPLALIGLSSGRACRAYARRCLPLQL